MTLIPLETLFGNPSRASALISPDASLISYLAPRDGVLNVWVRSLGGGDDRPVTDDRDRGVRHYFWARDDKHILYLQDEGGNENWRLYSTDVRTGLRRDLTPFDNVQVHILDLNKRFPDIVLLSLNRDNPNAHDAYRLTLSTGKLELIAKNPGNFGGWIADDEMKVRGAVRMRDDGGEELLVRRDESSEWNVAVSWGEEDAAASGALGFSKDGTSLYLKDSRGRDTSALVALDLSRNHVAPIAADDEVDVSGVVFHPDTLQVQMVSFERDRTEWRVLDSSMQADVDALRALHEGDCFIASRDRADQIWIVGFIEDDGPVPYYLYRRDTRKAHFLFDNRPELKKYQLAPMEPVAFASRDGLKIHGYLTLPPGAGKENLPLVLNVHGGPWVRDGWGYDAEAQWLANRGYACLQVNYRASTGYGKSFVKAGNKEWGGKCHDDLIDAVRWAVDRRIADPKRVAIYGGSYGGYAALVGATFTPDVFCCAVDIVGPSNLVTFIRTIPPYWSIYLAQFKEKVGDPDTEREFLESRSPLFKVDRIRIPMLIAQGANDPRVKQSESEQIVAAMRQKKIDCEYMLFPDEGHGFAKPANRLKFYSACERFLAKHLGGRSA